MFQTDQSLNSAARPASSAARGRRMRYTLGAVTIAAMMVGGAACSGDKKDDAKKSDKTEQSGNSKDSSESTEASTPPSTVSDDEFNSAFGDIRKSIEAAGTDPCKLIEAFRTTPPTPANETQVKEVLDTYETLLGQMAQVIGEDTDGGKALKAASGQMRDAAETAGFKPEFLQGEEFGKVMSSEAVSNALAAFQTKAASCITASTEAGAGTDTDAG